MHINPGSSDHYPFCHCKCGYEWNSGQTYAQFSCEKVEFGSLITVEIEWYFPIRIQAGNDKDYFYRMVFDFFQDFQGSVFRQWHGHYYSDTAKEFAYAYVDYAKTDS